MDREADPLKLLRGVLWIWAYHLWCWLADFLENDTTDVTNSQMVFNIVQMSFRDGLHAEEAMWQAVVLIPKGGGKLWRLGLVEVIWKTVAVILDCYLEANISLHDVLHSYPDIQGASTAYFKATLLQHMTATREEVLYYIYLHLHKTYDALYRYRCL